MTKAQPCHPETLARGPVARVDYCEDCRTLLLHVGPVAIRLQAGASESLWMTLSEAICALHELYPDLDTDTTRPAPSVRLC